MGMERRQVRFYGRVQGVGFRATTRSVAREYEVSGWVRNEPDGSVLAEVQGDDVDSFLAALRDRMQGCITSEVAAQRDTIPAEAGFEIRR